MTVQPQGQPAATAQEKAHEKLRENEDAAEVMRVLEIGEPPMDLKDWPSGPAKYLTYGSNAENEIYGEGLTANLGPANLRRFADGSIAIDGEQVDNPDDYRGEPLLGGPTDPKVSS